MYNHVLSELSLYGLVPLVVLDKVEDALPLADAYIAGGLPVMEVTLRTEAGLACIREIAEKRNEIILGAGSILTLEQCRAAVDAGAKFIVSPGFSSEIVGWCLENGICVVPGCVTPTEIGQASALGIRTVKFFPAGVYGGLKAIAALEAAFHTESISFMPTGGVNYENLCDYASKSYIAAVGGSWLCDKKDVAAGRFDSISDTTAKSVARLLGFTSPQNSGIDSFVLSEAFGISVDAETNDALTVEESAMVYTNNLDRAIFHLSRRGLAMDPPQLIEGRRAAFLCEKIANRKVCLMQK